MKDFLLDPLSSLKSYKKLIDDIKNKVSPIALHGILEENMGHFIMSLNKETDKQILLVTYNEKRSKEIYEDLKNIYDDIEVSLFPQKELILYDVDAFSSERTHQRLRVLSSLELKRTKIVVTSLGALLDKILSRNVFLDNTLSLEVGDEIELDKVLRILVDSGYERVSLVEQTGQFSLRGGIVDVFPPFYEFPVRIEFFDMQVDSIRFFDYRDQRSLDTTDSIIIHPTKELIIPEDEKKVVADKLEKEFKKAYKKPAFSIEQKEKLEKFEKYIEVLRAGETLENLDIVTPYINSNLLSSILEYFGEDSLVLLDEPRRLRENYEETHSLFVERMTDLLEIGEVLNSHIEIKFTYDKLAEIFKEKQVITNAAFLKQDNDFPPKSINQFHMRTMPLYHGKLDMLKEDLDRYLYKGYKLVILAATVDRGKKLEDLLKKLGIHSEFHETREKSIKTGQIYITIGAINAGFEYEEIKFAVISDKEIFGSGKTKSKRKRDRSKKEKNNLTFGDLNEGDYVVHEDYGIGQYQGIEKLKIQGITKDYLLIQYKAKDRLYLPIEQMSMIQKYIGSDSVKPKINRLNSNEWSRTKTKTKKAIEEMAMDLLELYAKREKVTGYQFSEDFPWQQEFEEMFPYEETSGQINSIEEIKRDMEKNKPMDRLLCGDVGYGKTEVALRAAFKAVMDSKQVAILVPTTILAQQHYNTLIERFEKYPMKIAILSRFKSSADIKASVEMIRKGLVDIVVGTHRLLSKDVLFKDLGLLVIDEEQRFGVKHKEALKKIKENVDVLTLTATPIPRTLHMSLVGIRDMSVIEEPPEERYPIQTYVTEYNKAMIRDAILREISRGGQIYYVYNRVETIDKVSAELAQLVPEASFEVGHGQMSERTLEKVMIDFMDKKTDVLVCTTIIETGLDIQNVNTIFVHDADKMGLSQLYQLRGRVGRSNRIAFAYFIYQRDKVLSEVAEKRLRAIKEFTEFGSGFKIAMRDLEIRGAGNLLGVQQHGNIETIGYDLYVKYLGQAIQRLKGEEVVEKLDTSIDIKVDGYITNNYIEDEEQKIEIYKRISTIESIDDYRELIDELIDRYGDLPKPVESLMNISYIRSLGSRNHIKNIVQIDNRVKLEYENIDYIGIELIQTLSETYGESIQYDLTNNPSITISLKGDIINSLRGLLEKIDDFKSIKTNSDRVEN
ncbi:MAG: transcription-repair coupling factor [Gudongella sp.]|nr:transcription-repair coupling factor [Gudongella sp.]